MIKYVVPLAGLILASSTAALADTPKRQQFAQDGQTYVYTVRERGALRIVDGTSYPSREQFHLVIDGNHVSGTSGQHEVAFDAPSLGASR